MVIKKRNFQARCVNNKYTDFGNHTGFKYVERTFKHLEVLLQIQIQSTYSLNKE